MASEKDIQDIINTLIAEGVGEGEEGMRRIAETILNRAEERGISPAEVVRQRAQYTGYGAPGSGAVKAQRDPTAISAAQAAWIQAQGPDDPTGGANHYFNPNIVTPSWASAMTPTGQYGNHAFYTDRPAPPRVAPSVPPRRPDSMNGLHPFDASTNTPRPNTDGSHSTEVTRTVQLPSGEWANVPSLWWGQGSTVRDFGTMGDDQLADFASRYEQSTGNAFPRYGSIAEAERAAIARSNGGGGTKAPITYPGNMVERSFAQMTSPSGGNSDLQTALDRVATRERNRVVPAPAEDRVTARNRAIWQTPADPFNGDPMTPASGPVVASIPTLPRPPTTRPVQTSTIRPSASDLVRGNPQQTKQQITTVASIPTTKPKATGMSYAGQEGGAWPKVSTFPTTAQIVAGTGFRPPPAIPERLPQGVAGLPALYGTGNVAGVGTKGIAPMPFNRPPSFAPTQMAQGKAAPVPFNRPVGVGTQLSVKPMPPMPIPRPLMGMGGPEMPAPLPAQMSQLLALQRAIPKPRPPTSPAAQKVWMSGFSDSESSGGAHGGSDKDKHPGVSYNIGRSY